MITPRFTIKTDDRHLMASVDALPNALRNAALPRITAMSQQLTALVKATEPVRTGTLRIETHSFVHSRENSIRGGVTITGPQPDLIAAAALEYGVHRSVSVSAHPEQRTTVFGQKISPETVKIRAHLRRVNIAARRFLRGPASALQPRFIEQMKAALQQAVNAVNDRS